MQYWCAFLWLEPVLLEPTEAGGNVIIDAGSFEAIGQKIILRGIHKRLIKTMEIFPGCFMKKLVGMRIIIGHLNQTGI